MRATLPESTPPADRAPVDSGASSRITATPAPRGRGWARVLLALACLPPLLLGWLVFRFGVDVPLQDEWALAYDVERFLDGAWSPSEVLRAHNGHRIAIPRLVLVPLAVATGWNVRVEMALVLGAGLACFVLVAASTRDLARSVAPAGRAAFLVFASVLLFSLAQVENWLWGFQIQALLGVLFALAAFAALRRDAVGATELGVALLACIGASLSQSTGLVAFVAAGVVLALPRPRGGGLSGAVRVVPWLALAIAATGLYLQPLPGDVTIPASPTMLASPARVAYFVASFLGAGVAAFTGAAWPPRDDGVGWLVGLAGVVAALALALPHLRRGASAPAWFRFLAGAAAYSVGCAASAALTRGEAGAPAAFASRYLALSAPLWLFVAALALERAFPRQRRGARDVALPRLGVALLVGLAVASSLSGLGAYAAREAELAPARRALRAGGPDALLARLHGELQPVRDGRGAILRRGLSVFRGGEGASPPPLPEPLSGPSQRLAWDAPAPARVPAGGPTLLRLVAENSGSAPWPSLGADAGAAGRVDLGVRFRDPVSRALVAEGVAAELAADVAPGERVALVACVVPPAIPGRYSVTLSLVQQHVAWFDEAGAPGLDFELEVTPPDWAAHARRAWRTLRAWLGGPACPSARVRAPRGPARATRPFARRAHRVASASPHPAPAPRNVLAGERAPCPSRPTARASPICSRV